MGATLTWLFYGSLMTAVVGLSLRRRDALCAAIALAVIWLADSAMGMTGVGSDLHLSADAAMDTIAAIGFILAWRIFSPPRNWLLVLALTYFAQVMAHRVYSDQLRTLQITLNVLFVLQLLTVVIGPRTAQMVGHARGALSGFSGPVSRRVRRRGVVASAVDKLGDIGLTAFRAKSR